MTGDNSTLTITLTVEPIHIREVGRSFSVRYNQGSSVSEHNPDDVLSRGRDGSDKDLVVPGLAKRDNHSFDDVWTYGYNPDIEDRLTVFPIDGLSADLLKYVYVVLYSTLRRHLSLPLTQPTPGNSTPPTSPSHASTARYTLTSPSASTSTFPSTPSPTGHPA